eukprot:4700806-Pleurochrysis_carterae.AAC.1
MDRCACSSSFCVCCERKRGSAMDQQDWHGVRRRRRLALALQSGAELAQRSTAERKTQRRSSDVE